MPRYWFRQKRFGYGATPNTWQGWLFTIAGAVLTLAVIIAADFQRDNATRLLLIVVGLPLILVPTVLISHAKTEGGWVRSGSPKGERNGPEDHFEQRTPRATASGRGWRAGGDD
jgi:hypothetical protein